MLHPLKLGVEFVWSQVERISEKVIAALEEKDGLLLDLGANTHTFEAVFAFLAGREIVRHESLVDVFVETLELKQLLASHEVTHCFEGVREEQLVSQLADPVWSSELVHFRVKKKLKLHNE